MATYSYTNPGQSPVNLDLPNEGEIFRAPSASDPTQSQIFKRQGGNILSLQESQLRGANNNSVRLGDVLPQYGINYGGIREVSPEAVSTLTDRLGHTIKQGSISDFQSSNPQNTGERFTQGIRSDNPNSATITSNLNGVVNAGNALPQQTQALTGALGSADRTNQLLGRNQFLNQPNQTAPIGQTPVTPILPPTGQNNQGTTQAPVLPPIGTSTNNGATGYASQGYTPPVSTGTSLSDQYFQQLLTSLKPSEQELATQQRLNDIQGQQAGINASRDLGIQGVNEQPIATPFLTGQSTAITNRAAVQTGALGAQAVPLQSQLALAQARRQSSVDISKTALDYQLKQQELQKPVFGGFGTSGYALNTQTGKYEPIAGGSNNNDILGQLATAGLAPGRYTAPGLIDAVKSGVTPQQLIQAENKVAGQKSAATTGSSYKMDAYGNYIQPNPVSGGNGGGTGGGTTSFPRANNASLTKQQEYADSTQRAFNTANQNLQALIPFMQQAGVNTGSTIPLINSLENKYKGQVSQAGIIAGFKAALAGLRAEYAQVLSRGGEVTDSQRNAAGSLIPDNLTPAQLQQVADRLNIEGKNAVNEANQQVQTIKTRVNGLLGTGNGNVSGGVNLDSLRSKYNY